MLSGQGGARLPVRRKCVRQRCVQLGRRRDGVLGSAEARYRVRRHGAWLKVFRILTLEQLAASATVPVNCAAQTPPQRAHVADWRTRARHQTDKQRCANPSPPSRRSCCSLRRRLPMPLCLSCSRRACTHSKSWSAPTVRCARARRSRRASVVVVVETLRSTFLPGNHLSATLDKVQLLMMVCASPLPTRPTSPAIRRRCPPPKCLRPNYIECVWREACARREAVCSVCVPPRCGGTGPCAARRSGGCGRA